MNGLLDCFERTLPRSLMGLNKERCLTPTTARYSEPPTTICSLSQLGEKIIFQLLLSLRSTDLNICKNAVNTLANIATGSSGQRQILVETGAAPLFLELLESPSSEIRIQATRALAAISAGPIEHKQILIQYGGIQLLLKLLQTPSLYDGINAANTLANIAAGTVGQKEILIQSGAVPLLTELLKSPDLYLCRNAAKALANVAAGDVKQKQTIIQAGAVPLLSELLKSPSINVCEQASRALVGIATGTSGQRQVVVEAGAVPLLSELLKSSNKEICENSTQCLAIIAAGTTEQKAAVIQAGSIPLLLKLLKVSDVNICIQAAKAIGKIAAGADEQRQVVIDAGAIPLMLRLSKSSNADVSKHAIWVIGNIASGSSGQKQTLIQANVISLLLELLKQQNWEVTEQAARALGKVAAGTPGQTQMVVSAGAVPLLTESLKSPSLNVCKQATRALNNIASRITDQKQAAELARAVPLLSELLKSQNLNVCKQAAKALNNIAIKTNKRKEADAVASITNLLTSSNLNASEYIYSPMPSSNNNKKIFFPSESPKGYQNLGNSTSNKFSVTKLLYRINRLHSNFCREEIRSNGNSEHITKIVDEISILASLFLKQGAFHQWKKDIDNFMSLLAKLKAKIGGILQETRELEEFERYFESCEEMLKDLIDNDILPGRKDWVKIEYKKTASLMLIKKEKAKNWDKQFVIPSRHWIIPFEPFYGNCTTNNYVSKNSLEEYTWVFEEGDETSVDNAVPFLIHGGRYYDMAIIDSGNGGSCGHLNDGKPVKFICMKCKRFTGLEIFCSCQPRTESMIQCLPCWKKGLNDVKKKIHVEEECVGKRNNYEIRTVRYDNLLPEGDGISIFPDDSEEEWESTGDSDEYRKRSVTSISLYSASVDELSSPDTDMDINKIINY
uniref:Uncharacterized protein n=1 Tax=Panagrolaimus sp. JU765 TaxID=591449 RepID=A0AC34RRD4_9BILA